MNLVLGGLLLEVLAAHRKQITLALVGLNAVKCPRVATFLRPTVGRLFLLSATALSAARRLYGRAVVAGALGMRRP